MQQKSKLTPENANIVAISALGYLADKPDTMSRFIALTGLDPDDLRHCASEPAFLTGVLDFFLGDEKTLLALSKARDIDPEEIAISRQVLAGPENFEG